MKRLSLLPAILAATATVPPLTAQGTTRVMILSGVTAEGGATDLWLAILRRRLDPAHYDSASRIVHPMTTAERAWADTIGFHARHWAAEVPRLMQPFNPMAAPDSVRVVIGNRGAEDAFSHDSVTIGLDLAALQQVYGSVDSGDNAVKLDRLFRHEFSHTLQKRWLARHPFVVESPLDGALLDIWLEGLGNYYSLGPRWQPVEGRSSTAAVAALTALEPVLVERLSELACADSTAAVSLLKGLSSGPFDQKWGAVSTALWLQDEMIHSPAALQSFVMAGPGGVWDLAARHLPAGLAARLGQAHAAATSCTRSREP